MGILQEADSAAATKARQCTDKETKQEQAEYSITRDESQQIRLVDEELLVSFLENNPDETDVTVNSVAYYTRQ